MKKVLLTDDFPGDSKGKTKTLPDDVARTLIDAGQAVEVADTDTTDGKPGAGRKVKTDKTAEGADNK